MLKIAREFVPAPDAATAESDWAVASTIVALGRAMKMRVIAEGIEQEVQLERLREMGCEFGQGFLSMQPKDAAGTEPYLFGRKSIRVDDDAADAGEDVAELDEPAA